MIRILHICNDFAGSKVHTNLVRKISEYDNVRQIVYCPVRNKKLLGGNKFDSDKVEFNYSFVIKPLYKFLYHHKIIVLFKDASSMVDFEDVDLIHATTLFSDGGIALRIHEKYNIPFVVAVRSVDIEYFAKIQPHLWHIGRKILNKAQKIYFISPALKEEFKNLRMVKPVLKEIEHKFVLRTNGIDDFWIKNVRKDHTPGHKIIFVGQLIKRKNLCRLIDAIKKVREVPEFSDIKLEVVGGGDDKKTWRKINDNKVFVEYKGQIKDKSILMNLLRNNSLFAMPSLHDTFGLTYIEALSQQLPIVYTKGQGVDGLFENIDNPVGIAVNPLSVDEIDEVI